MNVLEHKIALANASYVLDWLRQTEAPENLIGLQKQTVDALGGEEEGLQLRGVPDMRRRLGLPS